MIPTKPKSPSVVTSPHSQGRLSALYNNSAISADDTYGSVGNREDRDQTEKNVKLFAALEDDVEVLQSCFENLQFAINNKKEQALQKCSKNTENFDAVLKGWRWTKPLNWDFEKLIRIYSFNLSTTEMQMHENFIDFTYDDCDAALETLRSAPSMSRSRLAGIRDTLRSIDKQFMGSIVGGETSSSSAAPMSKFCIALFELAHTDVLSHARTELARGESQIAQIETQIEVDRNLRDTAIARGDVPAIEPPHRNMIKNYMDLLEILQGRIVNLTSTDEDTNLFRKNCADVVGGARDLIARLGDENRALQQRCLADIRRSEHVRVDESSKDAEATSGHKKFVADARAALDKNTQAQKVVLDKIAEMTKELFRLTEKRKELIQDFTVEKEREELRSAHFEEFGIVRSNHLPHIDAIRDLTERRILAETGLNDYVNEMQRRYGEMDVEGMLDDLVEPELKRYISAYRGLVFAVGDLMTKKSLRIETLLRQRRQLKLQQELAVSSLDSELGTYVKKHDDLTTQLNSAQADLAFLQNTQNIAEKNYAQIGALQQRFKLTCLHPLVEFASHSAEERQRFADVATKYIEDESLELDKSKSHVRQMIAMNEVERQQSLSPSGAAAARSVGMLESAAAAGGGGRGGGRPSSSASSPPRGGDETTLLLRTPSPPAATISGDVEEL